MSIIKLFLIDELNDTIGEINIEKPNSLQI